MFQRKDSADGRALGGAASKGDKIQNGNRSSFRTDAAISNSRTGAERQLKRWVPDTPDETDGGLEKAPSSGVWDQFAENERRFGLKTDYDENIYTTKIDKNHPKYNERLANAEKVARSIERSVPTTSHVAEERIMDFAGSNDQAGDEEEKYSGVRRQDTQQSMGSRENKYTPPARRAPTGQATVSGAPVDPAIISSQLKGAGPNKQPTPKPDEAKAPAAGPSKPATTPTATETKAAESKSESKAEAKPTAAAAQTAQTAQATAADKETTTTATTTDAKANDKAGSASLRPSAATSRTISPQGKEGGAAASANAPSASSTVETVQADVLKHFKTFATQQRVQADKMRSNKLKADTQVKLQELKKFADSFKLTTPVPSDLISIIAKDPMKQKAIQQKALEDAERATKPTTTTAAANAATTAAANAAANAAAGGATSATAAANKLEKEAVPAKDGAAAKPAEQAAAAAAAAPSGASSAAGDNSRSNSRPNVPQHTPSPSGGPGRHPGGRGYPQPHFNQQQFRNDRSPAQHMGGATGRGTGNLSDRLRKVEQERYRGPIPTHPHFASDSRIPPTGPAANSADPNSYARRLSAVPPQQPPQQLPQPQHLAKLNPNSHEFRPSPFAASFNPNHPSGGSSPRSAVNAVAEPPPMPSPQVGQLVRRKTKAIDVVKCFILSHIKTILPPQGRNWDENNGLRPSYDTPPTWRQPQDDEKPDSNMHLTYKDYFERMPFAGASVATPNPPHAVPQLPHQHQLPFHLQQGAHSLPRQSPHMSHLPMHTGQHGHVPHAPFGVDDQRMVQSSSAQSYASPRMAQVPMYPQHVNSPAQMQYSQPAMPQFMPGTPQMNQFRNFSNHNQYMQQQQQAPMALPMMPPQQFVAGPQPMMATGAQMSMYPAGQPHYNMAPAGVPPPQPIPVSNGYPSPGRPAAAQMMVQQGSQQGQPPMYGISPSMQFGQPVFAATPQQPQHPGQMNMRGYSNPGPQQPYGTSPQQMHQFGPQHRSGSNSYNKGYQGHNQHQGPQGGHQMPAGPQVRVGDGPDEAK